MVDTVTQPGLAAQNGTTALAVRIGPGGVRPIRPLESYMLAIAVIFAFVV
jgi:hypothetical protein